MATINQAAVKQDLYDAVNGEWLKTAVIPDDHSSTGGFWWWRWARQARCSSRSCFCGWWGEGFRGAMLGI